MPKKSKRAEKKAEEVDEKEQAAEEPEEIKKTSILISTKLRDRLWLLKFRKTYDEFLWELCDMYEETVGGD